MAILAQSVTPIYTLVINPVSSHKNFYHNRASHFKELSPSKLSNISNTIAMFPMINV